MEEVEAVLSERKPAGSGTLPVQATLGIPGLPARFEINGEVALGSGE